MGQSGQEDKKKIKTESGRYISSSYKRDLYPGGGWGAEGAGPSAFYIHIYCGWGVGSGRGGVWLNHPSSYRWGLEGGRGRADSATKPPIGKACILWGGGDPCSQPTVV